MFCCKGSSCLDEEQKWTKLKGHSSMNRQLYLQNNDGKTNLVTKITPESMNGLSKKNTNIMKPEVKHVTNIRGDIHVKLNGVVNNTNKTVAGCQTGNKYELKHQPKVQGQFVHKYPELRQGSFSHNPRVLQTNYTGHVNKGTNIYVSLDNINSSKLFKPDDSISISTEEALAIFDTRDDDSVGEDHRQVLKQLDDSINGYQLDDSDDTPMIVADILPPGVFDSLDINEIPSSPGTDSSEDEPSSGTSSLSKSASSTTGIISKKRKSGNSVSFKLPEGHVDKPYAPMQTSQKPKPNNATISIQIKNEMNQQPSMNKQPPPMNNQPTFRVTGNDINVWHAGSNVYVQSNRQRRMSGPFKGSFKSLFYQKYSSSDIKGYADKKVYLAPKVMEKVDSFENMTNVNDSSYHGNNGAVILRRHTFR